MTKVTITDTPSALIAKATSADVIAADGRTITLKKPGPCAQYDIVEAVGDSARNQTYMGMVLPLIYVSAIDGDAVALPGTKAELRALITRLGEDGLNAVMTGVQEHFAETPEQTAKKSDE